MIHRLTIKKKSTLAKDSSGAEDNSGYAIVKQNIPCMYQDSNAKIARQYARLSSNPQGVVYLLDKAAYQAITPRSELLIYDQTGNLIETFSPIGSRDLCTLGVVYEVPVSQKQKI